MDGDGETKIRETQSEHKRKKKQQQQQPKKAVPAFLFLLVLSSLILLLIIVTPLHRRAAKTQPKRPFPGQERGSNGAGPGPGLYLNWVLFQQDFQQMLQHFRVFVYPDVRLDTGSHRVFGPHPNPFDPKLGNYFSEHMFKISLLNSSFLTDNPAAAHFFFLPFSVNVLRNDPRFRQEDAIALFVSRYVEQVQNEFQYWNRTLGADHFYACCHSVGRLAASRTPFLWRNSVQITCSSSYFQRFYSPHKDVSMPQVWPRRFDPLPTPPSNRSKLAFYAGRLQNSRVRQYLLDVWRNDSDIDISSSQRRGSYEDAFRSSKFCLHVKGYEVNTARISDAIHFGCVPVIISDYYDLPFANVLDWNKFSIIISHVDIISLKKILLSISDIEYMKLHENVLRVRVHFSWQLPPSGYDAFHMTMYQLWLRRHIVRPPLIDQL